MSIQFTIEQVLAAMDVFDTEFKAWRVIPIESSQYNDHGILKYSFYHVMDDRREGFMSEPVNTTFERHDMPADLAKDYPRFRAFKKMLESVVR